MKKIGILGGGQLGRMFLQNATNYPYEYWVLDPSKDAPAKHLCHHFVEGDFKDYQTVIDFGNKVDILTIEIEHVNIKALQELEKRGISVVPSSATLEIIQDKGLQKQFFSQHRIPTAHYWLIEDTEDVPNEINFPCIQKLRKGGYDGKGVQLIQQKSDFLPQIPSLIEEWVPIQKELAVIVAKGKTEMQIFPVVEMVFDSELNLVDELFSPAEISKEIEQEAIRIANHTIQAFEGTGIFAVELFLTQSNELWVNEIAPRVHNSGHHTIEANYSSQFDALLRVLTENPLGNCRAREAATMLNIVAQDEHTINETCLQNILQLPNTYFHWYAKSKAQKGRKMGHVTVLGDRNAEMLQKITTLKHQIKQLIS